MNSLSNLEKVCNKCGERKPLSAFYIRKSTKDGHYSICKLCNIEYQRNYSKENTEKVRANQKRWRENNKEHIQQYKLDNKEKRNASVRKSRRKRIIPFVQRINTFKQEQGCAYCGFDDIRALHCHHRSQEDKSFTISKVAHGGLYVTFDELNRELQKCIVLCANCHYIHHAKEREDNIVSDT